MMLAKTFLMLCARWLTTGAAAVGLYWTVGVLTAPETREVLVHVWDVPLVVAIDETEYPADSVADQPLKLELRGGWHHLKLWRGDSLAYQNHFWVDPNAIAPQGIWIRSPRSVSLPPPPEELVNNAR